jgi:endonuclease/exonuclease/phosphatase family metal-dependent hydrolase
MQQKIQLFITLLITAAIFVGCQENTIRIAHFNINELSAEKIKDIDDQGIGQNAQLRAAAEIIQQIHPDILLIQEIDHDYTGMTGSVVDYAATAREFMEHYLMTGNYGVSFKLIYTAACNTGILSGLDLNNDGIVARESDAGKNVHGADSYGWGVYPGQYSMALYSNLTIDTEQIKTFQKFLWKDLPGHLIPLDYYSSDVVELFRLSSKSHWDIPVTNGDTEFHLFISHPTPSVFDGDEDRNGRRNFDEINFWKLYIDGSDAIYDDAGNRGGYQFKKPFIIAGDLNADPSAPVVYFEHNAINQLLGHPKIQNTTDYLVSTGSAEGREDSAKHYTVKFSRDNRMQIDYLLPSQGIRIIDGGVYWPHSEQDPEKYKLAESASDHRLIWLDIVID